MIESQELIDLTLELSGETLEFEEGEILGIPGHIVYNVPSFDSPFDIEKQDFSFQICLRDFKDTSIKEKDSFIYTLLDIAYSFTVETYVDDLVGWVQLNCSFGGIAE